MTFPYFKCVLLVFVVASLLGCVSHGSAFKRLDDDRYEVRAWDGYGCKKESDNKTCFDLLIPVVKDRAVKQCGRPIELASMCLRYEAATGDRVVCTVSCKDEGEAEVDQE